ncbi:FtsX-like permease family protein [Isoptericola variabilis]|uniref:ABC3 transporter permease C-terminal domain-containing protein n=1 Tax=Isoptericola variabilis (strain 225) TaxID=743718 RepID=F6FPR9_ISOV2|nr:FtsX-like permease family protein [Isoptericola variabilis]AEG43708.1 protein of unknown function DUF214 [Isoptericola variabilis 225]TWH27388.1 putative ABC transport system permease protein [Isoptericola variabilis J7]
MRGLLLLVRRHLRSSAGATLALALVALLGAAVVSAGPRALAEVHSRQLAHATAEASPIARDVVATTSVVPGFGAEYDPYRGLTFDDRGTGDVSVDAPRPAWDEYLDGLRALRDAQPAPLRDVLGEPDLTVSGPRTAVERVEGNDVASPWVVLRAGATTPDHVRVVEGRWPEPTPVLVDRRLLFAGSDGVVDVVPEPIEVALSAASAAELGWTVGSVHVAPASQLAPLVLVGIWEPVDPVDEYWAHNPTAVVPEVVVDPNIGKIVTAAAYGDPGTISAWLVGPSTRLWFPVAAEGVRSDEAPALLAQLRGLTSRTETVRPDDAATFHPASGLTTILENVLGRRSGVDAIVAVLAAGPLGAVAAVLVLGGRLVVERRRTALALVRARGASGAWARAVVGAEGLVTGVPAAAAGFGLGLLLVPGHVTGTQVGLAAAAGLAPAVALAGAASARGLRSERTDLGRTDLGRPGARARDRRRLRPVLETLLAAGAVASVTLLLQRGVVGGTDALGVDPLLAAAPLLLSAAVTLLAVRAFPWLSRGLERALARRADLVPFLGAVRATRDPAGGVVPALALVLAVAVATSSAVLQATVSAGITREAWAQVGADLRVAGPVVGEQELAALRDVDGVRAVSPLADLGQLALRSGASGEQVTVYGVDAAALADVQADVPGAPERLAELGTPVAGRLPVVASEALGVAPGTTGLALGATELSVLGTTERVPGAPPGSRFVLADVGLLTDVLDRDAYPRIALLGLERGLDDAGRAAVERAVLDVLPTAVVDDPVEGQAELLAAPSAAGLAAAFTLAVVLSGLLAAAAVVLTLVLAAPARGRLLAVLRTLGLPRRAERGLVLWEIVPWAAVALVVGAVLGWAVPRLVLAAVDLTPLTGGTEQPALAVDPLVLGALGGGFAVVVLAGAALAGRPGRDDDAGRLREQAD